MYKVVGSPRARTMRVLWMLEELGQDYEIVPERPHSDPVKAGNPGGKVPVLHDGDTVLTDSVAIVTYLADKHGGCTHVAGTPARGRQDSMTQFAVDEIDGTLWVASKNSFLRPEDQRCPEILTVCEREWESAMSTLAAHLGDREFIAGGMFTIPDLVIAHCAGWAARIKFPIPEGTVGDYMSRMRARPALARAMQRAEEADPS